MVGAFDPGTPATRSLGRPARLFAPAILTQVSPRKVGANATKPSLFASDRTG
jgi:hypothetical protein